jgi:roadblock/LC7 domain-containing protein
MKLTQILRADKLTAAIAAISKASRTLEDNIHIAAVSALVHAEECGNTTPMVDLLAAVPAFSRKNALILWAAKFGKFAVTADGKSVEFAKFAKTNVEAAMALPFWDFKPETPIKAFDLAAELAKLVARAEKEAKNDKQPASIDDEDLRAVRTLAAAAKKLQLKPGVELPAPVASNDSAEVDPLAVSA